MKEIDITEEMIFAGLMVLKNSGYLPWNEHVGQAEEVFVSQIFLAMQDARGGPQ